MKYGNTPAREDDEVQAQIDKDLVDIREDIESLKNPRGSSSGDAHNFLGSLGGGVPMNDMQRKSQLKYDTMSDEHEMKENFRELLKRVSELEDSQIGLKGPTAFDVPMTTLRAGSSLEDVIKKVNQLIQRDKSRTRIK